jgi:hypothetical protein
MRILGKISVLALAFCLCNAALGALAQAPQSSPSSIIAEIHATGSTHYDEAHVAAAAGLKPGDSVTREQLQDIADRLAHLGAFERVNYKFMTRANKIVVEFQLADAPAFRVSFDNFPWFSDAEITAAVRESVPLFNGTAPQDGDMVDGIASAIARLLSAQNIPGAVQRQLIAQPSSDAVSNDAMMMQFSVEGSAVTIASLQYGDSLAQSSEKLRDRGHDLIGKPFSRFAIELFENEQVRPLYLSTGHLRVQFGEPDLGARTTTQQKTSLPSEVPVKIPITPGPAFHFSGITWSGNNALTGTALMPLLLVKSGDLADGMQLAASWERVEEEYHHRGYVDAKLDPRPQFDDSAGTVTYNVGVTEGPQYRMGDLVLTGLSLDAERVLRTVWRQAKGDVFDGAYFDDMLVKLEKPSTLIFGDLPVHYAELGHWLRPNLETHTMDVLLDFK